MIKKIIFVSLLAVQLASAQTSQTATDYIANRIDVTLLDAPQPIYNASVFVSGNPGPATYYYWVVTQGIAGASFPAGPFQLINAPNNLSPSNFDAVLWSRIPTAVSYDVLRTTTPVQPTGNCNCAVIVGTTSLSVNDQSNSLSAYTVSTLNPSQLTYALTNESLTAGVSQLAVRYNGFNVFSVLPGGIGANSYNGIQMCDRFPGVDGGTKTANCMAALPAAGGIADARGFGSTTQIINTCPLNIGSATKQVTLLVDPSTRWVIGCTGGQKAIQIFNASALDCGNGATQSGGGGGGFYLSSTANVANMVANGDQSGAQEYMKLQGCYFQGNAAATVTDAIAHFKLLHIGTRIENNTFTVAMSTTGVINEAANAYPWINNWVNGTSGVGGLTVTPFVINGNTVDFTIIAGGIEHSCGASSPLLSIDGSTGVNGNSTAFIRGVSIYGTHFETDCGSNGVQANNIKGLHIHDAHLQICCGHTPSGPTFVLLSESTAGVTDDVIVSNLDQVTYTNSINDTTASGVGPITDQTLPLFIHSNTPARMRFNAQTNAGIATRGGGTGNNYEWGGPGTAGFQSTLGYETGTGNPFVCMGCEAGSTANTYKTRGNLAVLWRSESSGNQDWCTIPSANADNQTPNCFWQMDSSGNLITFQDGGPSIGKLTGNRPNNVSAKNSVNSFGPAGLRTAPFTFTNLAACASGIEGTMVAVSDSTTATWGATITGSGTNHVLAYCDGTNWTVAGK